MHESFSASLFEKAISARISTLSERFAVFRQLNGKPSLFLTVGVFSSKATGRPQSIDQKREKGHCF